MFDIISRELSLNCPPVRGGHLVWQRGIMHWMSRGSCQGNVFSSTRWLLTEGNHVIVYMGRRISMRACISSSDRSWCYIIILSWCYTITNNQGRCHIEYGLPWIWTRGPYSIGEYGPGGPYSPVKYGPPWKMDPPFIPTLLLLHTTLILLRIMYIAFPNLKHCKNKCLPVFLKIKKKNGPMQKHIRSLDPQIKLSVLLFWYLEGLIAWQQIVFVGYISR